MSNPIHQVFVKLLNGESKAINFSTTSPITSDSIKHRLSLLTGIPTQSQILISESRHIDPTRIHDFPLFCTLLVCLRGGKGGFGSLLRGAPTKAGQKKTDNFDACRDMSGRRLRHVNSEKRLEEWKAEAEERGLEKAAEEFLRKKMKAEGKKKKEGGGAETEKYVGKYREDSARCMEVVEKSVREVLGNKRKMKEGSGVSASKKLKIWMGKRKVDDSDGDDSEDDSGDDNEEHENGNSIVLDNENHLESIRETEGSSDSVTGGKMDGNSSAGVSSGNSSDGDEETAIRKTSINCEISAETMVEETVQQKEELSLLEKTVVSKTEAVENDYAAVGQPASTSSTGEGETLECGRIDDKMSFDIVPKPVLQEEVLSECITVAVLVKPLNFEEFNSSAELGALGMETLKMELQSRGLKCGGTLQERAARLFLLKTTPLDKLPKKLLAKK